jgi:hypothetical protein
LPNVAIIVNAVLATTAGAKIGGVRLVDSRLVSGLEPEQDLHETWMKHDCSAETGSEVDHAG